MKKSLITLLLAASSLTSFSADYYKNLTLDTIGVVRHVSITGPVQYGAGLTLGYNLNSSVNLFTRAIAYTDNNWGDSAVDEGGLGVNAVLLESKNKGLTLSAQGGVNRDFANEDWGFGIGLCPSIKVHKNLSLFAASEVRAWIKQDKDILTTFGLSFNF